MAYTVGIKKWLFGIIPWTSTMRVTSHSWENFRFIFTLENGRQLLVPGFTCQGVEVYADFWDHVKLEKQRAEAEKLAAAMRREEESRRALGDVERRELEELRRLAAAREVERQVPSFRPSPLAAAVAGPAAYQPPEVGAVNPEVYQRAQERVNGLLPS